MASEHRFQEGSDLTVIILTYNEELNIAQALDSVCGWARDVLVLDSFSTDGTLRVAQQFDCRIFQHSFSGYAAQRNYALDHLPIASEWCFFLDADEWVPGALKDEVDRRLRSQPREDGFYVARRLIWMGHWIRRGYYPTWILRLFRFGKARYEHREINEHAIVTGMVGYLKNDLIHEDRKGIGRWVTRHNEFASMEATELLNPTKTESMQPRFWGPQATRKRWMRVHVWQRLPPLIRPFFYYFYRYILRGGFLDGRAGFVFHFLQALWYPFLIDAKYLEMKNQESYLSGFTRSDHPSRYR